MAPESPPLRSRVQTKTGAMFALLQDPTVGKGFILQAAGSPGLPRETGPWAPGAAPPTPLLSQT